MAGRENLPGISSTLTDGNLNRLVPSDLGDSILLIGTAQRGPVNSPRPIRGVQDAIDYFGSVSVGNLVRSAAEALNAPGGEKDIRLVRISNGIRATLSLNENPNGTLCSAQYDASSPRVSLTLTADDPSDVYNDVTARVESVNGQESVVIYNPVTGTGSAFGFDTTGDTAGASKTVSELADAINADSNISDILTAEASEFQTQFEIYCNSGVLGENSGWLDITDNYIELNLCSGMIFADTDNDGTPETGVTNRGTGVQSVKVSSGNKLLEINECYSKENYTETLETKGDSYVDLTYPIQTDTSNAALVLLDVDDETTNGDGTMRHIIRGGYVGTGDGSIQLVPII